MMASESGREALLVACAWVGLDDGGCVLLARGVDTTEFCDERPRRDRFEAGEDMLRVVFF